MKKPTTNNQLGIDIAVIANKVETIKENVVEIKNKLNCMVPNDSEYKELKMKVDSLWDSKNKLVGWMLGAGIAGGGVSAVLSGLIKVIQAKF
jgi:CO dehydrogenase nickel-insertion accessory protein CooC1